MHRKRPAIPPECNDNSVSSSSINCQQTPPHSVEISQIISALTALTAPASANTSWSGTGSMNENFPHHLTCLMDSDDVSKVGRHRNIVKEFIPSNGVENVSQFRGLVVDGLIRVICSHVGCPQWLPVTEARRRFKSCHHCYTYYCSASCRQSAWPLHKMRQCPMGRAVSGAKAVLRRVLVDETALRDVSALARSGYKRLGRGCVVIWLPDCRTAERFALEGGLNRLNQRPAYVSMRSVTELAACSSGNCLTDVLGCCSSYSPDHSVVLNVSVSRCETEQNLQNCAPYRSSTSGIAVARVRHTRTHAVKKCMILTLASSCRNLNVLTFPATLLLTRLPRSRHKDTAAQSSRSNDVVHLLRQLDQRGVRLKADFPLVYRRLMKFSEGSSEFEATTIYPVDRATGRKFVVLLALQDENVTDLDDEDGHAVSRGSFISEIDAVLTHWNNAEISDL